GIQLQWDVRNDNAAFCFKRVSMKARRLAILCTHPIQYHSGWFKALAAQPKIDLEVLFCRTATSAEQAAAGFAVEFDWDVALLDGYQYRFLKNIARNPSVARFSGQIGRASCRERV